MLNLKLISLLARNDLRARFRGSVIGSLWLVVTPLTTLLIYSLVFSTIFNARWEALGTSAYSNYTMVLFPGLMMYQTMMEMLSRGGSAHDAYSQITTKMNVQTMDLIAGSVLASLVPFWATIAIWYVLVVALFNFGMLGFALVLLTTLAFSIFCAGLALLSTVLGALLKDWIQILGIFGMGLLFISPVLYPVDHLPPPLQRIIYVNPLSHFVDLIRQGAFQPNEPIAFMPMLSILMMAVFTLLAGIYLLQVLERFTHE